MMTNETADRIKGLAASMRATAHAGDVYSGKTLISKSNALRYADDFEALLSALDEAVSGWNEESEKLTDETERANAAEFLLALMAAAAETTYRTGFRDAERVTDERHIDYLRGNTIAGIAAAMQAPDADLTARVETLQARVGELEGALKPFAAFARDNTEAGYDYVASLSGGEGEGDRSQSQPCTEGALPLLKGPPRSDEGAAQ